MKTILFAALAVVSFASISEAARPNTRNWTCAQAKAFVQENAPVLLTYAYSDRAGWLYDIVDTHPKFGRDSVSNPVYAQTLDSSSCFIGYAND